MGGRVQRFLCNRTFVFSGLAASAKEIVVLERRMRVEGATQGTLAVAIHALDFGGSQRLILEVKAVLSDRDDPTIDFVADGVIASIELSARDANGSLRMDRFDSPHGEAVWIQVRATQASSPSTFTCRLTAELVLKSAVADRVCEPLVERCPAVDVTPFVLRARRCIRAPGPEYLPDRVEPVSTPLPPSWSVEAQEYLAWLPRIASDERCAREQEPVQRNPRKTIEQVVTLLHPDSAADGRGLLFDERRHLEPSIIVPIGDRLAIVWEKWIEDGQASRSGAVKPGVSLAVVAQLATWTSDMRGPPRITAIAAVQPRDAGEHGVFVLGLSRWPHLVVDLIVDVPEEFLPARLSQLGREGFRPRSITRCGTRLARRYAIVAEEDHRSWRALEDLDRRQLDSVVRGAQARGLIPRCLAEQPDGRFLCVVVEHCEPGRPPPRAWFEHDVCESELEATLESFACEGWRLVSALPDGCGGLHLLWVEELFRDATFSGLRFDEAG